MNKVDFTKKKPKAFEFSIFLFEIFRIGVVLNFEVKLLFRFFIYEFRRPLATSRVPKYCTFGHVKVIWNN